jgi:hypothetical protein
VTHKIAEWILSRIRSRAEEVKSAAADLAPAGAALREARFEDFEAVSAMTRRLGQGADSLENWQRLWRDNPALKNGRAARIGWLLEAQGAVVGFLGSIPLQYSLDGKELSAAATCRLAIEPGYRGSTALLVTSFFRQKDVDLFLNTTATPAAGRIVAALRAVPVPQADYGKVLFWVLRPRKFLSAVLRKSGVAPVLAGLGSAAGSVALCGDIAARRRKPARISNEYAVEELDIGEVDGDFEKFWEEQAKEPARLFAKRSAEVLRWHFQAPGTKKITRALAAYAPGGLAGYAVVRHEPATAEGMQRSMIADLMARSEDPAIVGCLLAAAYASAKAAGSDVLEVMGFPGKIRASFLRARPYMREYPACPYYFKARDRQLQEQLANGEAWYACPFDGDATLWP